jgi:glucose/mannose transport system substrate-binding protein
MKTISCRGGDVLSIWLSRKSTGCEDGSLIEIDATSNSTQVWKFTIFEEKRIMKNRLWLALLLITALVMVACAPAATPTEEATEVVDEPTEAVDEPTEAVDEPTEDATDAATEAAGDNQVEVFSWWTGGGEAAGLEAMTVVFSAMYPDIEFVNAAVAGGAGTNARAVLATRLAASDPPDSWQAHAGQEIIGTYVEAGQIEPLNDLYEEQGWLEVMPETLIPLISEGDNIYSVPVNIHRANVMWYNPTVLADAGILEPPADWESFMAACDAVEAIGKICLSLGPQWTQMHLLETVMLGSMGAEAWNGLWDGTTDWNGPEVTAALELYSQLLDRTNSDASALADWQPASKLVADGDAAFNIMGDWADGYFAGDPAGNNLGLEPGVDYAWAPVPGTDGLFQFLSDSFVLPVGAPHPDGSIAFLTVAGSKEGQEAFNPVKGSICARTDCDASLFGPYLQTALEDWSTDQVVGSLTHGVVANDRWKALIDTSLGLFLADRDVAAFQTALADACAAEGPCGE